MPILLTNAQRRVARWRANSYPQAQFVEDMLSRRGAPINRGPRGGVTYGQQRLTRTSYTGLKRRIEEYGTDLRVLEDTATNRVRVAPRDHPAFQRIMEAANATT